MTASQSWDFLQISGPEKYMTLAAYNAPFGRPRQKPVMKELIKSTTQVTKYPGRSGRPTRHSFGTMWEPMELSGRWMTKNLLALGETAENFASQWKDFVKDEALCRISWGYIVSYIGYIDELELSRESEHEIAWRMKISIDTDDNDAVSPGEVPTDIKAGLQLIEVELDRFKLKRPGDLLADIAGMAAEFQDGIDNVARDLNAPSAALNKLATILDGTEKATLSTLQHLRSAVKGIQIAFGKIRETVLTTPTDVALVYRTVEADFDWIQYQLDLDVRGANLLALLAAMDRAAELQQRQQATGIITARGPDSARGESWESLSIRATGNAQSAGRIREINGGGGHAVPGEDYLF